ncbi:uncharacterized protein [Henckelia pumila]|uniref:uncharacterized protein n=1 Tax=Henckelia pumila TaxID=405737 RepID=UPI003C6E637B
MDFEGLFYVPGLNNGGGLALLWKHKHMAKLLAFSSNFIDVEVTIPGMVAWRLTGFYGFPERSRRSQSWNMLRVLSQRSALPWCCIGDFNDLLCHSEKRGRIPHPINLINGFREAVNDSGLIDLGMKGHWFTWERSRGSDMFVEERLDRAMANSSWMNAFKTAEVSNLEVISSDHSAIFLNIDSKIIARKRRFRFENAWLLESECKAVVHHSWKICEGGDIQHRIASCGNHLQIWGDKVKFRFKKAISHCRDQLRFFKRSRCVLNDDRIDEIKRKLSSLLAQEEIFWKQRAKIFWLQAGDNNSKLFHNYASSRKRKNMIMELKDHLGNSCYWGQGMEKLIFHYFQNLYSSNGCFDEHIISQVLSRIDDQQNHMLTRPYEEHEVLSALSSMHKDKSPGPDGMNPGFYQNFWDITGSHVTAACLDFLNQGYLPDGINDTSIVLIPKKNRPEYPSDLRPISLCNVIYKLVAKVIANRLKGVLNSIISHSQSAFIPGRHITDNVLIAFEIGHYLKRKSQGKRGVAALKLDMSKAFDRVEWPFLKHMLLRLGFHSQWVELVMKCVSSVRYTVVHNGHEVGPIIPQRGLFQGDPLSPYLFLICMEGLSSLLQAESRRGSIHGIQVARNAPKISHLFFADDSYLFFNATSDECANVKRCLRIYEKASGQTVNFDKSSITFSPNLPNEQKHLMCEILGVRYTTDHGHYLGLPSVIGRNKTEIFAFLKEKAWKRMTGWKNKWLSRAGKEILLKSVVQALPTYVMSVFLLPQMLCSELERMMNSFWWGKTGQSRGGMKWLRWEKLSKHKAEAKIGSNPSYVWRSLLATQDLIRHGARRRIGSGEQTLIWGTPWLPDSSNPFIVSACPPELQQQKIRSLRTSQVGGWDMDILNDLFEERDKLLIQSTPLSKNHIEDRWNWGLDSKGCYTVKSGYKLLSSFQRTDPDSNEINWLLVWRLKIPPKVRNFIWRTLSRCLPTKTALRGRRIDVQEWCPFCNHDPESDIHVLVRCSFARNVWCLTSIGSLVNAATSFRDWWTFLSTNHSSSDIESAAMILWNIWNARNDVVWNGFSKSPTLVYQSAVEVHHQWLLANQSIGSSPSASLRQPNSSWTKPPINFVKCNVDAAVFKDPPRMGYGCIIRDSSGVVIKAICGCFPGIFTSIMAEAMSIREALSWLKELNISNVIVESDALLVVNAFHSSAIDVSGVGLLMEDCRFLASELLSCSLSFVYRSANQAAHRLARSARSLSDSVRQVLNLSSDVFVPL